MSPLICSSTFDHGSNFKLIETCANGGCTVVVVGAVTDIERVPGAFPSWGLCMFSPCMRGFSPGTPASSHRPKTCLLGYLVTLNCPKATGDLSRVYPASRPVTAGIVLQAS